MDWIEERTDVVSLGLIIASTEKFTIEIISQKSYNNLKQPRVLSPGILEASPVVGGVAA